MDPGFKTATLLLMSAGSVTDPDLHWIRIQQPQGSGSSSSILIQQEVALTHTPTTGIGSYTLL